MIEKKQQIVKLRDIAEVNLTNFTLETVSGRDLIAEQIHQDIDDYCLQTMVDHHRSHLGASLIGHNCDRLIWFRFRWMKDEQLSARQARLFNRGHLEEERVIDWLRGIGMTVQQTEVDGKQIRIVDAEKHFGGSCDGNATLPERYGLPVALTKLLLEVKTANSNGFTKMLSGVRKANNQYWVQMCVYGMKLRITHALFICVGKNDDDISCEILELDWDLAQAYMNKAFVIINSQTPPPKLSNDPSYYECKWCKQHGICHLNQELDKNCRSCQFATPAADGQWQCNNWNAIIPPEAIANGCDAWKGLPR